MQQGRYVGRLIDRRIAGKPAPGPLRYFAWAAVHLEFLAQSSLRVSVFMQWVWTYLTGQRGSRLIVDHRAGEPVTTAEAPGLVRMEK
jgi:NADH dehydrogenase